MKKKKYEKPEITINDLNLVDSIATSGAGLGESIWEDL